MTATFGEAMVRVTIVDSLGAASSKIAKILISNWDIRVCYLDSEEDIIATYLPGYGRDGEPKITDGTPVQKLRVSIEGRRSLSGKPGIESELTVSLTDPTNYPGYCGNGMFLGDNSVLNNRDDVILYEQKKPDEPDVEATRDGIKIPATDQKVWFKLGVRDYAASAKIVVSDGAKKKELLLPKNSDASSNDHLPDAWEDQFKFGFGFFGDLNDQSDEDQDHNNLHNPANRGDGLTAFEEYRGFLVYDPQHPNSAPRHFRTDKMIDIATNTQRGGPTVKDAFITGVTKVKGSKPEEDQHKLGDYIGYKYKDALHIYGISWHVVDNNNNEIGMKINVRDARISSKTDVYCVPIVDKYIEGANGESNGELFNINNPVDVNITSGIYSRYRYVYNMSSNDLNQASSALIAHEIGHRLGLKHVYQKYGIKGFSIDDLPSNKLGCFSECDSYFGIKVKLWLVRSAVIRHFFHSLEYLSYRGGIDKFLITTNDGQSGKMIDILLDDNDLKLIRYYILDINKTLSEGTMAKITKIIKEDNGKFYCEVFVRLKYIESSLVDNIRNNHNITGIIHINRGNNTIMDCKISPYDTNISLISAYVNPNYNNGITIIQENHNDNVKIK